MSTPWEEFLKVIDQWLPHSEPTPGKVMVTFLNRYLKGVGDIKVRLVVDGDKTHEYTTTDANYSFELSPRTLKPIQVLVWSRKRNAFKRLKDVQPVLGQRVLEQKIINTVLLDGKTQPFDEPEKLSPPKPTPAPAPGPSPDGDQGIKPDSGKDANNLPVEQPSRPVPNGITAEQLAKVFVQADKKYLKQVADELNTDLERYKLDTPYRKAHFFGQIRQESGPKMAATVEGLNYSVAALKAKFGYYKARPFEAHEDGYVLDETAMKASKKPWIRIYKKKANEEVIANKIYGPKPGNGGLGNDQPGDGWKYRGRGLKQLTGKDNYKNYMDMYKNYWNAGGLDINEHPELIAELPHSVRSAVFFWVKNKCWMKADGGVSDADIDAVTKIVNSGEVKAHEKGDYPAGKDPVVLRREYTKLAYKAFV